MKYKKKKMGWENGGEMRKKIKENEPDETSQNPNTNSSTSYPQTDHNTVVPRSYTLSFPQESLLKLKQEKERKNEYGRYGGGEGCTRSIHFHHSPPVTLHPAYSTLPSSSSTSPAPGSA